MTALQFTPFSKLFNAESRQALTCALFRPVTTGRDQYGEPDPEAQRENFLAGMVKVLEPILLCEHCLSLKPTHQHHP